MNLETGFTCADGRIAADNSWVQSRVTNAIENTKRKLPLHGFLTSTDHCIETDHVWTDAFWFQSGEYMQCPLPFLRPSQPAESGIVTDNCWSEVVVDDLAEQMQT